jgi:hypothetical protein
LEISLVPVLLHYYTQRRLCLTGGVVQDFGRSKIQLLDRGGQKRLPAETGEKGHFLYDLIGGFPDDEGSINYVDDEEDLCACGKT